VQFNDGSNPLLNNCFILQSQLQMQKLLWHDPRVNLTISHRNLINIFVLKLMAKHVEFESGKILDLLNIEFFFLSICSIQI